MTDLTNLSLEELQTLIRDLEAQKGIEIQPPIEHRGMALVRALELQGQTNQGETQVTEEVTETNVATNEPEAMPVADTGDKSKFNTVGKRGPNLGTGAYAKQRIRDGLDNKTILAEIREKFPEAQTSLSSIAFYRNAIKKEGLTRTPESLRAKAVALRAEADTLDAEAASLETAATTQTETVAAQV